MKEFLECIFDLMTQAQSMRKDMSGPERKQWVIGRANIMLTSSQYSDMCSIEMLDAFIEIVYALSTTDRHLLSVFKKSCCIFK
jgi:hypothetical protein